MGPVIVRAVAGFVASQLGPEPARREFYSAASGLIPVLLLTLAVQVGAAARVTSGRGLGRALAEARRAFAMVALAVLVLAELFALYTLGDGDYQQMSFFREPKMIYGAIAFGLGMIGVIAFEPRQPQLVRLSD
jgi:hypothetical protein